ncbi:MAG TPA: sugar phosphate isomerase/epimerase family protein [Gemmataceae bacterium]|nr:sugar phosphate isomerase/epimerase family protein [Gemmataceae bacterium]
MNGKLSRRAWLAGTSTLIGAGLAGPVAAKDRPREEPFGYCLNTSTIMGQKLTLVEQVEVAAKAGYQGIEPWISDIDQHVKRGGRLKDVKKHIRDSGLSVESAIGFSEWIVDDDDRRKKGLEDARRTMDLVRQIGGKRIAAPPAGATNQAGMNLLKVAERYRALLDLGQRFGLVAELEVWGFSRVLGRLGETAYVAMESNHPRACLLPDVFHLYKGGSGLNGLRLLSGEAFHVIHVNDYPAKPSRALITDAQRVYPGDGVAPLKSILRDLRAIGFRGMLSLELFNRDYWKQDPLVVARTGLEKMRSLVRASGQ